MHAESKISMQSVEQQTGYREEDVLPKGLDDKQLRDNWEVDAGISQLCVKNRGYSSFEFVVWFSVVLTLFIGIH